jgi:hypothetical protein
MSSWKKPTDELIDRALGVAVGPAYAQDFLQRLENPEWIEPLLARGYFNSPPGRIVEDEGRTISLPIWPLSRYLVRVASEAEYATSIQRALLAIPATDNEAVHDDIVGAAASLPGSLAKPVAAREVKWLRSVDQLFGLIGRRTSALIIKLAVDGEGPTAFELARAVLRVRFDKDRGDVIAKVDSYDYEKIVEKTLPSLVAADATETIMLFSRLLTFALDNKRHIDKASHDYSYIWHAHIDVDDNPGDSIEGILVSAVRDAALEAVHLDAIILPTIVDLLKQRRWLVFHRIALFLLTRHWQSAGDRARAEILNRGNFDEHMIRREYDALVHEVLCTLPERERSQYFQWIATGPDRSYGDTDEERTAYAREWKRDRLRAASECIPTDLRTLAENLPSFDLDPEEEIARVTNTWMETPIEAGDLEKLDVVQVLAYLAEWQPGREHLTSRVELGHELQKVIASRPAEFLAAADEFKPLHPTYARALIEGLTEAIKSGTLIDWNRTLGFARWAATATYQNMEETHGITDPDYSWTLGAIMRLFQAGFGAAVASTIPVELATMVWDVIRIVTDDPDPARDEPLPMNTDPSAHALNSNRGRAFHTLISYLVWLRNHLKAAFRQHPTLQDVERVLTDHLPPEEAPAILSIYGQYFPWLRNLLPDWTARHVDEIFPAAGERSSVWPYTWPAYLIFCGAYNDVFDAIQNKYGLAAMNASASYPMWSSHASSAKKLMEHIAIFYGRGVVDDDHEVFKNALATASPELRAHTIWFVNNVMNTEPAWATESVITRFQNLWDRHMANSTSEEAQSIGWFSLSAAVPAPWFLERLIDVLHRVKAVSGARWVMERLAALAEEHSRFAVEALRLLLDASTDTVGVHGWHDEMTIVLERAANSPDETARRTAADVVNKLGRMGFKEYRATLNR